MDDLRDGILRTPLDPIVTFLDDPLRILRAVRFASRFNLVLEGSMRAAIELGDVKVRCFRCCRSFRWASHDSIVRPNRKR